jgi:hypothetical protein
MITSSRSRSDTPQVDPGELPNSAIFQNISMQLEMNNAEPYYIVTQRINHSANPSSLQTDVPLIHSYHVDHHIHFVSLSHIRLPLTAVGSPDLDLASFA